MKTIKETRGTLGDGTTASKKKRGLAISPELSADLIMALDFANACFAKIRMGAGITHEDELEFESLIAAIEKKYHITFGR